MDHPLLLVPAAGIGQRFRERGYKLPKPLIPFTFRGRHATMLEHVLSPYDHSNVIVGVRPEDFALFQDKLPWIHFIRVFNSAGQADTIYRLLRTIAKTHEGLKTFDVLNSDVYAPRIQPMFCTPGTTYVSVMDANEPCWSYVDSMPFFQRCVEKEVISRHAVVGVYRFPDPTSFHVAFTRYVTLAFMEDWPIKEGEAQISGVLDCASNTRRFALKYARNAITMFGTPDDIENNPEISNIGGK